MSSPTYPIRILDVVPLWLAIVICCAMLVAAIVYLCITAARRQHDPDNAEKSQLWPPVTYVVVSVICLSCSFALTMNAASHGMTDLDNWPSLSLYQTIKSTLHSPVAQTAPDDLEGQIVILYKFGCPDCEAIYDELSTATDGREGIWWVSSRSEQGRALVEAYSVPEVPSLLYFRVHHDGNTPEVYQATLYTKKGDLVMLDRAVLAQALDMMEEHE